MNVLLDTCCLIWAVSDPAALSPRARSILESADAAVHVSCISCSEIACLCERGRVRIDRHWKPWFNEHVSLNGWTVLDIDLAIIQEAYSLPGDFHRDPVDRILVATSRLRSLTLLTADTKILSYPHVASGW